MNLNTISLACKGKANKKPLVYFTLTIPLPFGILGSCPEAIQQFVGQGNRKSQPRGTEAARPGKLLYTLGT
jgi:hypothetical protein